MSVPDRDGRIPNSAGADADLSQEMKSHAVTHP